MSKLATHRCIEVRQEIGLLKKQIVETSFDLALYPDRIETENASFPIGSVFDISYRLPSGESQLGFLYLHTSQGVVTYKIKQNPESFIKAFKKLVPETKFRS
ncbi:hypothetical protein CAY60_011065 [Shouchella clausii]|jgi:hypothetical protein|uniref:Uncharacterized protein n=3 Tax=Shouchella TaxID=2893057 RepID=Q5WHP1_SHOC1|nr:MULTISPECIES: hypothetical protein [Shouchella]MCM3313801.1 hypothetical protein [Psychrobacillus sp. MER TA 17]PAD43701.1 hypothetical protein CHH54_06080 [Bacillus sp. 7520-S]SPU21595.1 Uncharacterised protein [Niallia circulans]ALA51267.1 hypothetical protein DB29_00439 [Shouchella clausii]AST98191.1 hypothetical protein BC8716_20500 [Shouchella clausii]